MAYTDVEYTRKRMKDTLLMGPTPKLGRRRAEFKFKKQPDYLAGAKRHIREWAKEETARKAREQAALDKSLETEN
jgi:hypothetical protein